MCFWTREWWMGRGFPPGKGAVPTLGSEPVPTLGSRPTPTPAHRFQTLGGAWVPTLRTVRFRFPAPRDSDSGRRLIQTPLRHRLGPRTFHALPPPPPPPNTYPTRKGWAAQTLKSIPYTQRLGCASPKSIPYTQRLGRASPKTHTLHAKAGPRKP